MESNPNSVLPCLAFTAAFMRHPSHEELLESGSLVRGLPTGPHTRWLRRRWLPRRRRLCCRRKLRLRQQLLDRGEVLGHCRIRPGRACKAQGSGSGGLLRPLLLVGLNGCAAGCGTTPALPTVTAACSACSAIPSAPQPHHANTPVVPPRPPHQPRWPPVGVSTSRHCGLASIASKGMASLGAMGSSSACG